MNALLNHVWGISPAQDRVWAQVTGIAPRLAVGRLLMVFQAFVDESFTQGATYVLGGYIADADTWARFAKDWDEILPLATRSKSGAIRFKMKEMAANPSRMKSVPTFYSVIEKYDLFSLSCRFNLADLKRAKQRVYVPNLKIDWGYTNGIRE